MKRKAFTLAEVLITLGIIGIVAAMTLPTLITQNHNKALETALKKNYTVLLQALEMYQAKNGEPLRADEIIKSGAYSSGFKNKLKPYLNVMYDCGTDGRKYPKVCIPYDYNPDNEANFSNYKTYSGERLRSLGLFDDGQIVLQDGTIMLFENPNGGILKLITVDINGRNKNPNRWGEDLFTFQLTNDGQLLPMGAPKTSYNDKTKYCSASSTHQYNGIGCTYWALSEKDYFNKLPR